MKVNKFAELVYESLNGNLIVPLAGVPNAFAPGSKCERLYADVLAAYGRLCGRLGTGEEDADVEIIIDSLLQIQRILGIEMYRLGLEHGS